MSLTTIDPKAALVVIDLQKGIVRLPSVHPMAGVVANTARLAAAFRRHSLPVVLVNAAGRAPGRTEMASPMRAMPADWLELVPELDAQPTDVLVTKMRRSAFHETKLHQCLQELGVTQIVLTGVATSVGVESTARSAHDHGYHVALTVDAMTDLDEEAHNNSISRIFPKLGETGTTEDVLAALEAGR